MDCPRTPVERLQEFRPPFCPRRDCPDHRPSPPAAYRCSKKGFFVRKSGRRVRRFRCPTCKRGFSQATFSATYFLKRPALLVPIFLWLTNGSAHRQIARAVGCAPSTVTRMSARIGRHCMVLHARALAELAGRLRETVVFDHFESFELTQDYPVGLATAVGQDSWFLYAYDPAPHGRGGRLGPAREKRLRSRPPRQSHGGYLGSTGRVLETLLPLVPPGKQLQLASDDKPQYRQAVAAHAAAERIRLAQYPNPPPLPKGEPRSAEGRCRDEALFPVDQLHGLLRHSVGHHRRETIAFARRLNAMFEKFAGFAVWKNFVKGRSERKPDPTTPAMRLELAEEPWTAPRIFSRRQFPERVELPPIWPLLYRRDWTTPLLPANRRHRPVHAW